MDRLETFIDRKRRMWDEMIPSHEDERASLFTSCEMEWAFSRSIVMRPTEQWEKVAASLVSRLVESLLTVSAEVTKRMKAAKPRAIIDGKTREFTSISEKFRVLADNWLEANAGRSRIDFSHPSYLQIIGMGPSAVSFLLKEIQARSGNWFQALRSIVGATPVSPSIRGDFEAVTLAWLRWGVENGYIEERQGHMDAIALSEPSLAAAR